MEQHQIKEQIEGIISKRKKERLPKIRENIVFLRDIVDRINNLDNLIGIIRYQCEQKQGPYYQMLLTDPAMESRFNVVSTVNLRQHLYSQISKLENLEKRFSRDAVQIAFVGYERQGKSRFLQSISGLSNSVIPAYSGTSCTGTVSVIHNVSSGFKAKIEFYSLAEFLEIMSDKLKTFFPGRTFYLNSVQGLKTLDLSGFNAGTNIELSNQFEKFINGYVNHADDIEELIGREPMTITDEKIVIQHVAQYEEFQTIPAGENPSLFFEKEKTNDDGQPYKVYVKNYYKYLAVKSANIYTQFPTLDDAKIVLVDTIGLGDSTDAARIEDEMFRVLKEDCDAAVDVFKPDPQGGGFNQQQSNILTKIGTELKQREPNKWLLYVINRVECLKGRNTENIEKIKEAVRKSFTKLETHPVADVLDINGADPIQVNKLLLSPLLDIIIKNLEDIDSNYIEDVNNSGRLLYQEYKQFNESVSKVISGVLKQGSNEMKQFRTLYKSLTYSHELRALDNEYLAKKDVPCDAVKNCLEQVISTLTKLIDKPSTIVEDVTRGRDTTNAMFEKYIKIFRNRIYDAFNSVNINVLLPLQENVKLSIAKILFTNAKFGSIPLQEYAIEDGPSIEWLNAFLKEKIDKEEYPRIYSMLKFVTDYQLNIQGLVEYNVAKCINTIDPTHSEFNVMAPITGVSDMSHATKIWSEIVNRTAVIQSLMRQWRDDFSLIPSHSFYARISMFRDMMVDDVDTEEELYNFYTENRMTIWRSDFAGMMQQADAFGAWNEESDAIAKKCVKNSFIIK